MSGRPPFEFLEHTADVYIIAYGKDLNEAFANAAKAMFEVMTDISKVRPQHKVEICVEGDDLQQLLYNWLEELLVRFEVDGLVFSDFKVEIRKREDGKYELRGIALGEPFDPERHPSRTAVKAVTYCLMEIHDEPGNSWVRFVLDI